jgi:hypothetical protein
MMVRIRDRAQGNHHYWAGTEARNSGDTADMLDHQQERASTG